MLPTFATGGQGHKLPIRVPRDSAESSSTRPRTRRAYALAELLVCSVRSGQYASVMRRLRGPRRKPNRVTFADDTRMAERRSLAYEFYEAIGLDDKFKSAFISDEVSLYNLGLEDDGDVVRHVSEHDATAVTTSGIGGPRVMRSPPVQDGSSHHGRAPTQRRTSSGENCTPPGGGARSSPSWRW